MLSKSGSASLFLSLSFGPAVLAIMMPVLPSLQGEFQIDLQATQLSISAPMLMVLLAPVAIGMLVDRVGRKQLMLLGVVFAAIGCVVSALSTTYEVFLAGRVVAGLMSSLSLVIARSVLHDVYQGDQLSQKVAKYSIAPIVAMMIAPLAGALIIEFLNWRWVFWFLALIAAFTAVFIQTGLPETHQQEAAAANDLALRSLLGNLRLWGYVLPSTFHYGVAMGFCAAASHIMMTELGRPVTEYALGLISLLLGLLAGVLLYEKIFDRFTLPVSLMCFSGLTLFLSAASFLIIGMLALEMSPVTLFLPATVMAVGLGLAIPPAQAGMLEAVPGQAGTASGVSGALQLLAAAVFIHLMAIEYTTSQLMLNINVIAALVAAWVCTGLLFYRRSGATAR